VKGYRREGYKREGGEKETGWELTAGYKREGGEKEQAGNWLLDTGEKDTEYKDTGLYLS